METGSLEFICHLEIFLMFQKLLAVMEVKELEKRPKNVQKSRNILPESSATCWTKVFPLHSAHV